MAKLSTDARHRLPDSAFALPNPSKGGPPEFPLTSTSKAHNALSGAAHAHNVGNITDAEYATVQRKAKSYLAAHGQPVASA